MRGFRERNPPRGSGSDGTLVITANESNSGVPHKQGITILDLRGGPGNIEVVATYNIFDLTPDLLEGTNLTEAPVQVDGEGFPAGPSSETRAASLPSHRVWEAPRSS